MLRHFSTIPVFSVLALMLLLVLPSCVGYQLGNTKHQKLRHIDNIYVPLVNDKTQEIKLAPQTTNEIIKAISNDGTYRITKESNSDATLNATIEYITFREFRSNRFDTLRADELTMNVRISWRLVDRYGKVLEKGNSTGITRYFADSNQRLSRDNAKTNALQKAAQKITSQISNGF